jgi:hypothetical protein
MPNRLLVLDATWQDFRASIPLSTQDSAATVFTTVISLLSAQTAAHGRDERSACATRSDSCKVRIVGVDDIFGYDKLVAAEKVTLHKGDTEMNQRLPFSALM